MDVFAITPEIVQRIGFEKSPPDFHFIVAEDESENFITGMLVYYFLPCTARKWPAIYIKQLYVHENYRGQKIGDQLMEVLKEVAQENNCIQIKWTVAPWNKDGIRFYERLDAQENKDWLNFEWNV